MDRIEYKHNCSYIEVLWSASFSSWQSLRIGQKMFNMISHQYLVKYF